MAPFIINPYRFGGGGGLTATGGEITVEGDYNVHTFTSPGTFEVTALGVDPVAGNKIEYLVVGGGGGGGANQSGPARSSGAGGAGEVKLCNNYVVSVASYAVTVGTGGAGAGGHSPGTTGNPSTFGSFTVIGGGGGGKGGNTSDPGASGGSGGGGGSRGSGGAATGSYRGYPGGSGQSGGPSYGGGGGGGAGSSGYNGGSPATGGAGVRFNSNYYAGGGGGGSAIGLAGIGGSGVGGNGGNSPGSSGTAGAANTGSGGGGASGYGPNAGGGGADGVVVIKYPIISEPTVGGWVELGRTSLRSAGDTIDVTCIPNKRYLKIIRYIRSSGDTVVYNKINNDSGSNYSYRWSEAGGSESTATCQSSVIYDTGGDAGDKFDVTYMSNLSCREKLAIGYQINQDGDGAGTAAVRGEAAWKWTNTSDPIDQITTLNTGQSGDYDIGSEVIVLGFDPGDSHSDSVFEELASVDLSGGANSNLSTSSFSSKKYLWVQGYFKTTSGTPDLTITFNNDTGSNYTRSRSINNTADVLSTCRSSIDVDGSADKVFINMFIVNTRTNEKLVYGTSVRSDASGASGAPDKREWACKWVNTSSQISEIDFDVSSSTLTADSTVKVWGFD